jgi:hypothetical protein
MTQDESEHSADTPLPQGLARDPKAALTPQKAPLIPVKQPAPRWRMMVYGVLLGIAVALLRRCA